MSGMSIPPTNPTLPVFEAIAAAMPTRNEPSCSLNTIDRTLGRFTTASTMANLMFGNSLLREADTHDDMRAASGHVAQRLLALRLGGHLELAVGDAGFLLEALGALVGGFVEGLVELAAHVEHHGRNEVLRLRWCHPPRARSEDSQQRQDGPGECAQRHHAFAPISSPKRSAMSVLRIGRGGPTPPADPGAPIIRYSRRRP